ncbi:MAG: hypothetical protein C0518_07140 [Opitutus sp.]|nr:hypothetical protein [Opitutus sp.]
MGNILRATAAAVAPVQGAMTIPLHSSVEMRAGRPTLVINGEPHAPLIYALTDCPGARLPWEEVPARNIKLFGEQGVRLFQVDLWLEQMLRPSGRIDPSFAQRIVRAVREQCPAARVMFRLHVNPPLEWCCENPDECVGYADIEARDEPAWGLRRPIAGDGGNPVRASFASRAWSSWANQHLGEFCRALTATPEGDHVFAIQIANGLYGEWHQFGFLHHDPDTGVAAVHSFRRWLTERYGDDAGLALAWHRPDVSIAQVVAPSSADRETVREGILRDPQTQQHVIDYFRWLHETMADALLTLASTVKTHWPRPIVTAAFQGYFYGQFARNAAGSHLAMDQVLASPALDCLCSPASYTDGARAMGGSGHGRGIMGAVRRAGKLWLDENDHGTFLVGCPWDRHFETSLEDDIAYIRRNTLQPVLRGGGQWWFDFGMIAGTPSFASHGNVGWWDDPRLATEIRRCLELAQSRHGRPFVRPADVLVIHDPWSFCHTVAKRWSLAGFKFGDQPPVGPNPFSGRGMDGLLEGLFRSGLTFDEALIGELATIDLSSFKLIFFGSTPVLGEEARRLIASEAASAGRHLVMLGFSGWGDTQRVNPDLACEVTGIPTRLQDLADPRSQLCLDAATEDQRLEPPKQAPAYDLPPEQVVGRWSDGSISAGFRHDRDATWWTFAVPPVSPDIIRTLGRRAGCHIVNDHNDATTLGDGLVMIHTLTGGPREIRLPSGPVVSLTLPPRSTTLLDAETGAVLLG